MNAEIPKKRKKRIILLAVLALFCAAVWLNNTSRFSDRSGQVKFLAHKGLAQDSDVTAAAWDVKPADAGAESPCLENTIESMKAAFSNGADAVEFDLQLAKDGSLVLFGESDLASRTDGKGQVADYTMQELKKLDLGYQFTQDGGKTYPFRGKGVGQMAAIDEVFEAFPNEELLIHIRSGSLETGKALLTYLKAMTPGRREKIAVYGAEKPVDYLRGECPGLRIMDENSMIKAFLAYEAVGWTGYVPKAMRNTELHLPLSYARFLWGFPVKLNERLEAANSRLVLVNGSGEAAEGFDSREDLAKIPAGYAGFVWTNRVDLVKE